MTQSSNPVGATSRNKRATVAGVAAVAVLLVAGAATVMTREGRDRRPMTGTVPLAAAAAPGRPVPGDQTPDLLIPQRTKGDPAAPIAIYEVADFQCPACRLFWAETMPAIEREYVQTGKARIVFINFPITSIHRNAEPAHVLAMCAAHQGRFWRVHDLLFDKQSDWATLVDPAPYFSALADSAGLSQQDLASCVARGQVQAIVQGEAEVAWQNGVKSTPSFIVQGALLAGAAPISVWRPILDSIFTATTAR